jgi:hypothetical protein
MYYNFYFYFCLSKYKKRRGREKIHHTSNTENAWATQKTPKIITSRVQIDPKDNWEWVKRLARPI